MACFATCGFTDFAHAKAPRLHTRWGLFCVRCFRQWHPVRRASSLFCSRYVVMIEHHALPRAVWFPSRLIHGFVLCNPYPATVAYQHIRSVLWGRFNRQPAPNIYVNRTLRRQRFVVHLSSFLGARPVTSALEVILTRTARRRTCRSARRPVCAGSRIACRLGSSSPTRQQHQSFGSQTIRCRRTELQKM